MIINADCLNYFPSIEDKSIDLVLTDPPYEISQYSTGDIHLPNRKKLNNNIVHFKPSFDVL